jgi:hypothetical protein
MSAKSMIMFKPDPKRNPPILDRFYDRERTCSYVRVVAWDLADYVWDKWQVRMTVTEAWRSVEENAEVGGKETSQHLTWKAQNGLWVPSSATDFRSSDLNEEQIKDAQAYVGIWWYPILQAKLLYEPQAKSGPHLHLQTAKYLAGLSNKPA